MTPAQATFVLACQVCGLKIKVSEMLGLVFYAGLKPCSGLGDKLVSQRLAPTWLGMLSLFNFVVWEERCRGNLWFEYVS